MIYEPVTQCHQQYSTADKWLCISGAQCGSSFFHPAVFQCPTSSCHGFIFDYMCAQMAQFPMVITRILIDLTRHHKINAIN